MVRLFLLVTFFSAIQFSSSAQSGALKAYVDHKQFYAPEIGNYIEFYFHFAGYSLKYEGVENGLQSKVILRSNVLNEQKDTVYHDYYLLKSPVMLDSIVDDFYELQRMALKPGKYTLHIGLQDYLAGTNEQTATIPFTINDDATKVSVSEIEAIEYATRENVNNQFFKSGYTIIPRISTYYSSQLNQLPVYLEIYNTTNFKDSVFALKQYIVNTETGAIPEEFIQYSKHNCATVVPVIRQIDIENLESGNYTLNFTVLDKNMTEYTTKVYAFERENQSELALDPSNIVLDPSFQASITDDSIKFYLGSLIPIAKPGEIRNILEALKKNTPEQNRKYIQAFWKQTAPVTTYESWIRYKIQVQHVQKDYATNFQAGYETDRGRVFLQYGAPTHIIQHESSPLEYPYEIWQYNKIGRFSNKRFIFYNPTLVDKMYVLLHSDMLGETHNTAWQYTISRKSEKSGTIYNSENNTDHFGGTAEDMFKQ